MTRIFKDESGQEFELDVEKSKRFAGKGTYVIKRIKAVEKADYALGLFNEFEQAYYWSKDISLTEPQAQKVAEAIEALMAEIMSDGKYSSRDYGAETGDAVAKARAALQGDV